MNTKKIYLFPVLLLALLLPAVGVLAQSAKTKRIVELNSLFSYLYKHDMFNGAAGIRYKGDVIFKRGYGKGNFERGTSFTPASQTEIGSISKQFTAAAIMILWKNGKLQLDDNINTYFEPKLPYDNITIKDLLTHQSGLPRYTPLFYKHDWDKKQVATNEDIVNLLRKFHPESFFEPETSWRYSNLGYILLAQIVDHVSGKSLDEFLNEHVFRPFGMSSTGFYSRSKIFHMPLYAPGVIWSKDSCKYTRPDYTKKYVWYLSGRFGSGRITSSVNDLLKWDQLLYTDKILSQAIIQKMYVPRVKLPGKPVFNGYGWMVESEDTTVVYHTGSWPGNSTYIKRYLDEKSTIILLNNTSSPYMKKIRETVDAIIEGTDWSYPKAKKNFHPCVSDK